MTSPLLSCRNVSVSFGGVKACHEINLDVPKGKIVGLIGPNGAGKTTLFNVLTRFQQQDTGHVFVKGENVDRRRPHDMIRLGMARTFQNINLFKEQTTLDNILIGSHIHVGNPLAAMTWLGGFPPFAATTTLFAGLLLVWLVIERLLTRGRSHALRLATQLLVGLALGAAWALPQVLPSLAFFAESARPVKPLWSDLSGQAFEPYGLLGYLMPTAFGDPTMTNVLPYGNSPMQLLLNTRLLDTGKAALPNYNFTEYSVFISSFGAVLMLLGAICGRSRRGWFARTALLLALGLGLFWPGLQLLFHLPLVQNVWPIRWPAAGTLFVVWLAALGLERLLTGGRRIALLTGCITLLVAGLLLWATKKPLANHQQDGNWAVTALQQHFQCKPEDVVNHVQGVPQVSFDRFARGFEQFANDGKTNAA